MLYPWRESLLSQLYPGFFHSTNALKPAVETFEARLHLPHHLRHKIIWRLDAGFGSDANVLYLLRKGYRFIVKGCSNRRAAKLASLVKLWREVNPHRWVGRVPTPEALDKRITTLAVRTQGQKKTVHSYLLTNLPGNGCHLVRFYDQRGGAETEFRADKSGGGWLHKRRKHRRDAQEAWLHLTDMAHNFLAWFARKHLSDTPFDGYGPLRITRDLFRTPGQVNFLDGKLSSVNLLGPAPHSVALLDVLRRFSE